jgi:hypothetical protein
LKWSTILSVKHWLKNSAFTAGSASIPFFSDSSSSPEIILSYFYWLLVFV